MDAQTFLEPDEVSEILRIAPAHLRRMRTNGTGPRFTRLGAKSIVYRWSDIEAWLEERTYTSTDEYPENVSA